MRNPDGQISSQINLVVNAPASNRPPTLSGITPNPITKSNTPAQFSLTKADFAPGAKVKVAYATTGYAFVNTRTSPTFVNSNRLTVPITTTTTPDTWKVRVQNPDNQLSGEVDLVVNPPSSEPEPTLSAISPSSVTGSLKSQSFLLSGSNFVAGTLVQVAFQDNYYRFEKTAANAKFLSPS